MSLFLLLTCSFLYSFYHLLQCLSFYFLFSVSIIIIFIYVGDYTELVANLTETVCVGGGEGRWVGGRGGGWGVGRGGGEMNKKLWEYEVSHSFIMLRIIALCKFRLTYIVLLGKSRIPEDDHRFSREFSRLIPTFPLYPMESALSLANYVYIHRLMCPSKVKHQTLVS